LEFSVIFFALWCAFDSTIFLIYLTMQIIVHETKTTQLVFFLPVLTLDCS